MLKFVIRLLSLSSSSFSPELVGHLLGLAVMCWTTDHYHPCLNLAVDISEGCFIFHFNSLPLEATMCTEVAVKHQSSSPESVRMPCWCVVKRHSYSFLWWSAPAHFSPFTERVLSERAAGNSKTHLIRIIKPTIDSTKPFPHILIRAK